MPAKSEVLDFSPWPQILVLVLEPLVVVNIPGGRCRVVQQQQTSHDGSTNATVRRLQIDLLNFISEIRRVKDEQMRTQHRPLWHAVVSIQLNIVAYPTYPAKLTRDNFVSPLLQLSVVIIAPPRRSETITIRSGRAEQTGSSTSPRRSKWLVACSRSRWQPE